MSENDKHRARIFLHRGNLLQARAAWDTAVADDRAAGNACDLSDSLGNLGNVCALMQVTWNRRSLLQRSARDSANGTESARRSPIRW